MRQVKVAGASDASHVAGAISGMIRSGKQVATISVGADSIRQAVRAIALSREFLRPDGIAVTMQPANVEVDMEGKTRVAVQINVVWASTEK